MVGRRKAAVKPSDHVRANECPSCHGTGRVESCMALQDDLIVCIGCDGTGRFPVDLDTVPLDQAVPH